MAWKPLKDRFDALPLILAGPILRRTEATSVSVWVAFKRAVTDIELRIHDDTGELVLESEKTSTLALGSNLHVALVTAEKLIVASSRLEPGVIYTYDLLLGSENGSLSSPGILSSEGSSQGGLDKITYGSHNLPTFVLPADDIDDLRIIHGSCRKPHGGETDALRHLDVLIEETNNDPVERPQLLCLTGDQIYADECTDLMLYMIKDAADHLVGIEEELPGNIPVEDLLPGNRQKVNDSIGFTSGAARSHLFKLSEFYMMYMFVWSPELWDDEFPTFEELYQGQDRNYDTEEIYKESVEEYKEKFGVTPIKPITSYTTGDGNYYNTTTQKTAAFRNTLPFIRKALANIPSYMIFDDHEITDDLFIHQEWTENALALGTTSRRIIQNGFASYAIFQAWGNTPSRFKLGTKGRDVFDLLNILVESPTLDVWNSIGNMLLPQLVLDEENNKKLVHEFEWNYHLVFNQFQLIFLDTRNNRVYRRGGKGPGLINLESLPQQLPSAFQEDNRLTILISPVPIIGHDLLEHFIQKLVKAVAGPETADFEAWSFDPVIHEALLEQLVKYEHVLMLSGDVHFGFSNTAQYWNHRIEPTKRAAFAQLCSSSLKNLDWKSKAISERSFLLAPEEQMEYVGWLDPGNHISTKTYNAKLDKLIDETISVREPPYVKGFKNRVREIEHFNTTPAWRYRINFIKDKRDDSERNTPDIGSLPNNPKQRYGKMKRHFKKWSGQKVVVGKDNIGEINFEWGAVKKAKHLLWYETKDADNYILLPLTKHEVSLNPPTDDSNAPGA